MPLKLSDTLKWLIFDSLNLNNKSFSHLTLKYISSQVLRKKINKLRNWTQFPERKLINYLIFSYHKVRDSLLSSSSGFTNYRGFLNLAVILLIMSSGRLVLENILKYGLLVRFDAPILFMLDPNGWPGLLAFLCKQSFKESLTVFVGKINLLTS